MPTTRRAVKRIHLMADFLDGGSAAPQRIYLQEIHDRQGRGRVE